MCVYGYEGTIPLTMEQMIAHSQAVRKGASGTYVIGDMPFLSYQRNVHEAVYNAGRPAARKGIREKRMEAELT
jgi:3-methyl-2-oxobutanoate hydroxymethyltransferase